ncbi:DUF551 domain-containing protein [Enterobacter kobei]|uniref:DUF551 domain-containing protein n=1 Tax=Enterobacter kobei TaxID=208224 RepID=UPI00214A434B|nr:DUF551 domain-containing protein [Enterobacter kobei]MCR2775522.1 DUF551 domain-containing protein [Enterobacter kobei]
MSTITKERIELFIKNPLENGLTRSEQMEVARISLASLEADPIGEVSEKRYGLIMDGTVDLGGKSTYRIIKGEKAMKLFPLGTKFYTAPPAPVSVPDDYFSSLVSAARVRADKAMRKFPQPNYVLNKVAEESGEVIKAVIHFTEGREEWQNVEGEIIDNLAMLIRLVMEGDQVIGFTPPDACRAAMLQGAEPVTTAYKLPANTPCKDAPEHIWLQTAGIWPENGEFSELTWCSDNQHHDDTLYVRADVVTGNSPVMPDGWVILPAEPTQAMMNAWLSEVANWRGHAAGYRAMIAAAPQQEVTQALAKGMERYGDAMQKLADSGD